MRAASSIAGANMQLYSTQSVSTQTKITYWNEIISDVFTPLEILPTHRDEFDAEARAAPLGRLRVGNVMSMPAKVIHSSEHAQRCRSQRFFLHLQVRGKLLVSQAGREALLQEGDFALLDGQRPYSLHHEDPCNTVVLGIAEEDLEQHLPNPEDITAQHFAGQRGISNTTSLMLRSLWDQAGEEMDPEIAARVADSFLELFAATWLARRGVQPPDSAVVGFRRTQIKRYIEAQLRDPALSVSSIAAAFGISARYLHMLFGKEGETVSNYIMRRRLDQCIKQLSDSLSSKRTITEIAFSWGFNNATHFARVFRQRYDMTPRDYRNRLFA
jgi:AraC-like DNA-binding protein